MESSTLNLDSLKESLPDNTIDNTSDTQQKGIWEKVTSFFTGSEDDSVATETIRVDTVEVDVSEQLSTERPLESSEQLSTEVPVEPVELSEPRLEVVETKVVSSPPEQTENITEEISSPNTLKPSISPIQLVNVQTTEPQVLAPVEREQYANHQIERPEIAVPCFKNLPLEVLYELIRDGQMFAPDIFEENYNGLPDEFKTRYTYEPVQMIIDNVPEILAFKMIRRYQDDDDDDDTDSDDE